MRDINISLVSDAFSTSTRTVDVLAISQAIKQGDGEKRWRESAATTSGTEPNASN